MKKLIHWKHPGWILFILLLLFSGCGPKEPTLDEKIAQAEALLDAGQLEAAIRLLNNCQEEAPERVDVLEALAFAHSAQGDPLLSAMIFAQIAELVPDRAEYRLYAAESLREAEEDEAAIEQYRMYLLTHPRDTAVWGTLANIYEDNGSLPDALECLLAAEQIQSRPDQKMRIARLYLARANLAQAQAWFSRTLDAPAMRDGALLGLLETAIRAKRFADAEALMVRLDAEYPGKMDQSDLAELRPQLVEWRRRQDAAQAALAAMEERKAMERQEAEIQEQVAQERVDEAAAGEAGSQPEVQDSERPANETEESAPVVEETVDTPAQVEETPLIIARRLRDSGDYSGAVKLYKQLIVENDALPDLWAELSEVYFEMGQARLAQATASEAMRRDPTNPKWVLQFLRAAQSTLPPSRLIEEMEAALRRFPDQPEIMLVLARVYAGQGNQRNARLLYERFLDLAPFHPQRAQVENELFQLGG
jgi:tetratricopeptide (TPR) repeat protein